MAERTLQVEPGEPVLFIRGNHPLAVKMAIHWAALNSVDPGTPTEQLIEAAGVLRAMQDWKAKKNGAPS